MESEIIHVFGGYFFLSLLFSIGKMPTFAKIWEEGGRWGVDQTRNFVFLDVKEPFDHRKEFLKVANSTSKDSSLNPLQVALLTRHDGNVGITMK